MPSATPGTPNSFIFASASDAMASKRGSVDDCAAAGANASPVASETAAPARRMARVIWRVWLEWLSDDDGSSTKSAVRGTCFIASTNAGGGTTSLRVRRSSQPPVDRITAARSPVADHISFSIRKREASALMPKTACVTVTMSCSPTSRKYSSSSLRITGPMARR